MEFTPGVVVHGGTAPIIRTKPIKTHHAPQFDCSSQGKPVLSFWVFFENATISIAIIARWVKARAYFSLKFVTTQAAHALESAWHLPPLGEGESRGC
jgi:hypothetical protein